MSTYAYVDIRVHCTYNEHEYPRTCIDRFVHNLKLVGEVGVQNHMHVQRKQVSPCNGLFRSDAPTSS